MKNEINAVLENMTTTIPEPEDYTQKHMPCPRFP